MSLLELVNEGKEIKGLKPSLQDGLLYLHCSVLKPDTPQLVQWRLAQLENDLQK